MRRLLFLLPVAVFVAIAVYFLLALNPNRYPTLVPSALIDKPAPEFTLGGLNGAQGIALDGFKGQVRNPVNDMPAFSNANLSDKDIADIYAFVRSLPGPRSAKDIPILNN